MFSQIKDRKHIEQNFHSVARVMPRGIDCGCWGESKTLMWGFAMAPHRLHALVTFKIENIFPQISVHFYLHLSLMSTVLAQEGVQITVKLFLHCRSFEFRSKYSISTLI